MSINVRLSVGECSEYFDWLCDIVGGKPWVSEYGYEALARLFERAYYWSNPVDGNLKTHVDILRGEAMSDGVGPIYIPAGEPSILEVLVVLAQKIDSSIMYDAVIEPGERVPSFFHDLMMTLGFTSEGIDEAIDQFLDGQNVIAEGSTLWSQCNQLYYERFNIENEEA